jgi:hypothetical protein
MRVRIDDLEEGLAGPQRAVELEVIRDDFLDDTRRIAPKRQNVEMPHSSVSGDGRTHHA